MQVFGRIRHGGRAASLALDRQTRSGMEISSVFRVSSSGSSACGADLSLSRSIALIDTTDPPPLRFASYLTAQEVVRHHYSCTGCSHQRRKPGQHCSSARSWPVASLPRSPSTVCPARRSAIPSTPSTSTHPTGGVARAPATCPTARQILVSLETSPNTWRIRSHHISADLNPRP